MLWFAELVTLQDFAFPPSSKMAILTVKKVETFFLSTILFHELNLFETICWLE